MYSQPEPGMIMLLAAWRTFTQSVNQPDPDRDMGAYVYHTEGVLLEAIQKAIAGTPWHVEFGLATVQFGQGNARIVTQPIHVFHPEYSVALTFWGIGEGVASNGCHVLTAATVARRQALLCVMGWKQSRDDTDGEYNAKLDRNRQTSTPDVQIKLTNNQSVESVATAVTESAPVEEKKEPKKPSKAQIEYGNAKTLLDLAKSSEWLNMLKAYGLRLIDVETFFTVDWKHIPKEEFLKYGKYVQSSLQYIPAIVDALNDLYQRQRPDAIPFVFDETTSVEDVHRWVEGFFGEQLPLDDQTLQFIKQQ